MADWVALATQLAACVTGITFNPPAVTVSTECIESKLIPTVAEDYINGLSNVVISGTNPAPLNRSWSQVNKPAIALIVIMAIVSIVVLALVIVCVCCARRGRQKQKGDGADEEMSEEAENPLAQGANGSRSRAVEVNDDVQSRGSSRYESDKSTIVSPPTESGPLYGIPASGKGASMYSNNNNNRQQAAPQRAPTQSMPSNRNTAPSQPRTQVNQVPPPYPPNPQYQNYNGHPQQYQSYKGNQQQHGSMSTNQYSGQGDDFSVFSISEF